MKVFAIIGRGNYGDGVAIVAAKSEKTARKIAKSIRDEEWNTDYEYGSVERLTGVEFGGQDFTGPPQVLFHHEIGE